MKKPTLTFLTCLFIVLSAPRYAEWTKVGEILDGDTFYVDFERIRKHGGYVYFWQISDYLKPTKYGDLSGKSYMQGDCKLLRFKALSNSHHKEPMGQGTGETNSPKNPEWEYPPPDSIGNIILIAVCKYAK